MQLPLFKSRHPQWVEAANYQICRTRDEIVAALEYLRGKDILALDVETTGLEPYKDKLVGISISAEFGQGYYFPIRHIQPGVNIGQVLVENLISPFIGSRAFIFHNSKFDLQFLMKDGIYPKVMSDTLFLARIEDPFRDNGLKPLGESLLGLEVVELKDLVADDDYRFQYFTPQEAFRYACQDSDLTLRVHGILQDNKQLTEYIENLEMGIVPTIARMELNGFPVDIEKAKVHYSNASKRLTELEQAIYSHAGTSFNIGSGDQLADVLFHQLGLKSTSTTKTGKPSTGDKALKSIKGSHPIIELILEYKEQNKLISGFYGPYFERLDNQGSSRIYSQFNPTGARTGRFSSSNVNLQQVSPAVKEIFLCEPDHYLVEADYSQIEYRIFASMCQDPFMVEAYLKGEDFHEATANRIRTYLDIPDGGAISKDNRRKAKTLNFSVLFGSGDRNVASQLGCDQAEAKELIAEYYRQFPTISGWKEKMHRSAAEKGYCETAFGRKRFIPEMDMFNEELYRYTNPDVGLPYRASDITKDKFYKLLHGMRVAVNTPVQGTAADIFKVALRRLDKHVLSQIPVILHAVVHDSYIMSVHKSVDPAEFKALLEKIMEIEIPNFVPIVMDVEFGHDWKNVMSLEKFLEKGGYNCL